MATSAQFAQYICQQAAQAGDISCKKMFGEYGVYCDNKFIGVICDNQFYVKITPQGQKLFPQAQTASPYAGAKPYFLVENPEDKSQTARLVHITADALPAPKSKPRRAAQTAKRQAR